MNFSTILKIGIAFALVIFIMLYLNARDALEMAESIICTTNETLAALQLDNERLNTYIVQKEDEITTIVEKYKIISQNIPADACGDAKPSEELLIFLKETP